MKVVKAHQTAEALKGKVTKDIKKRHDKSIKRGVAQASKAIVMSNSFESIQTNSTKSSGMPIGTTKVKQQCMTQIIGSVPINLVDVRFCMVNSTKVAIKVLLFQNKRPMKILPHHFALKLLNNSMAGRLSNNA
uniref:Uncharacterized protein n=1 Tax=Cannabis sativa TaxID=3483 RepID=A0A803QBB1_CANSA